MIVNKLEPGHLHLQVLGIQRISRTVQWFMEAAQLDQRGLRRIATETTLTSTYLATFTRWLMDDSTNSQHTRNLLDGLLEKQETLLARLFRDTETKQPPVKQLPRQLPAEPIRQ